MLTFLLQVLSTFKQVRFRLQVDMGLKTLDDFLPIDSELEIGLHLHLPVLLEHARVPLFQLLPVDLVHLLHHSRLTAALQRRLQRPHFVVQLLHFCLDLGHFVEAETGEEMRAHDGDPLVDRPDDIFAHIVDSIECLASNALHVDLGRTVAGHQCGDVFQLIFHFGPHLLDALDLGDDVGFAVQLQVVSDALRAQQLHALQAEVSDQFGGVRVAVVGGERGGTGFFSESGGGGQKGAGVGVVGGGAVETGVLLVQEVHSLVIYMGGGESAYAQRFHSRYNFVQSVVDRNFGPVKVYRKREQNFDYVMIVERQLPSSDMESTAEHLESIRHSFTLEHEPMLLRLLHVEKIASKRCGSSAVRLYIEYLNFSLRDVLELRRSAGVGLSLDEVMYVLQCGCETYRFFKNLDYNYLSLRADAIFITPEGLIRFSPIRIEDYLPEPEDCDCNMQSAPVHFQKTERQFLIELKNLLLEMVSVCPRNDENFKPSYQLLSNVNHCRTYDSLQSCLWPVALESLNIGKKLPESTDISATERPFPMDTSQARSKRSLKESGSLR